jgi:hypothetical protein
MGYERLITDDYLIVFISRSAYDIAKLDTGIDSAEKGMVESDEFEFMKST